MKSLLMIVTLLVSTQSFASVSVNPTLTANAYSRAYEVVIDGEAARKLYDVLDGRAQRVRSGSQVWLNKIAQGIVCGKIENKNTYACSMVVDSSGVN